MALVVRANEVGAVLRLRRRLIQLGQLSTFSSYFSNCRQFAGDMIKWKEGDKGLAEYQGEICDRLIERRRVAVRGPHGLGKTALAAILILWFALTREIAGIEWKVVTTAGSHRQLKRYLWPEIHHWARKLDWSKIPLTPFTRYQLLATELKLSWGQAFAVASSNHELIEGAHAPQILFIFDESKAIAEQTFDACEGAFSIGEAYAIALSTPGEAIGRFYDIHCRKPGFLDWDAMHVTKERVIGAGQMSRTWADARRVQWGVNSRLYLNRVKGEFSIDDKEGIIPLAWIRAAQERWKAWKDGGGQLGRLTAIGGDIAAGGVDATILAHRENNIIGEITCESSDTMQATGAIARRLKANPGASAVVDIVAVGTGVVHRLRELEMAVIPFNGGKATSMRDMTSGELEFADKRSAAYWHFRELLDPANGRDIMLPEYETETSSLTRDLTVPRWREESNGKIRVESKRKMRSRIGGSTDAGDAVVMAFWPECDGIFKRHWWRYWCRPGEGLEAVEVIGLTGEVELVECVELPERFDLILQTWHSAFKDDEPPNKAAFVVGQVHGYAGADCFLIDQDRRRYDFPGLITAISRMNEKWPGSRNAKLIDKTQNGPAIIRAIRKQVSPVTAIEPEGNLVSRANAAVATVYNGRVFLPHPKTAGWVEGLVSEAAEFPNGANVEQVSALTLALSSIRAVQTAETEFMIGSRPMGNRA